jgi:hypothetical protein
LIKYALNANLSPSVKSLLIDWDLSKLNSFAVSHTSKIRWKFHKICLD